MPIVPDPPLSVDIVPAEGGTVAVVVGELDLLTAPELTDALHKAIDDHVDGDSVLVDLSGLSFCDSSGLAALIDANLYATEHGRSLVLLSPQRAVLRVLRITGLARVFEIRGVPSDDT